MTDIFSQVAAICGLILSVASVITLVINGVKKAKTPEARQNERLDALEKAVLRHDELFRNDLNRFERMENGNRIMQRCMLALLSHGIDGNDIEQMKLARKDLNEYLINH